MFYAVYISTIKICLKINKINFHYLGIEYRETYSEGDPICLISNSTNPKATVGLALRNKQKTDTHLF